MFPKLKHIKRFINRFLGPTLKVSGLLGLGWAWEYTFPNKCPGDADAADGRRSPVGCSPWGRSKSDRTERLHFHFSPSCIGEGNGNPLQYSCLENPGDRGAWWAAVYEVTQSRTRLKWLSTSSKAKFLNVFWGQKPIWESLITHLISLATTSQKNKTQMLKNFDYNFRVH